MNIVKAVCFSATFVTLLSACASVDSNRGNESAETSTAKKSVVNIPAQYDGGSIRAHFWVPQVNEPMPAVILLHGSGGTGERRGSDDLVWKAIRTRAHHLNEAGFATLILDSWSARGIEREEGTKQEIRKITMRASDVVDATSYLMKQSSVRDDAIAAVGFSQGAPAALAAVDNRGPSAELAAIVGWYPSCPVPIGQVTTPTLFLAAALTTGFQLTNADI